MSADFLIIGLATDGPSDVVYQPKNLAELNSLYGANLIERHIVSATATSLTTSFVPLYVPTNRVDCEKQYLYMPYMESLNPNNMDFGNIGGSGNHIVDLYYTPYMGEQDLIAAASRYYNSTNKIPYILRLGGNTALCSGDGNWLFEAKYAGSKYNNLMIIASGNTITVSGLEPSYMVKTYTFSDAITFSELIEMDFYLGTCPIICTVASSAMLSSGTYFFSGGTDGSFSDADFDYFLSNMTIPLGANHVLLLNNISSGVVNSITNELSNSNVQPRMFFIPSLAYTSTGGAYYWLNDNINTIPFSNSMIASFIGDITVQYRGQSLSRYAAEGAAIAYAKSSGYNLTNLPVEADNFSPVLDETDLDMVISAGYIPIMRYIENDISVYEGTTMTGTNTFLFSSKTAEISSVAYDYCYQYYGVSLSDGNQPDIANGLATVLAAIEWIQIQQVTVSTLVGSMYVNIEAYLPDEILNISFTLANQ